MIPIDFTSHAQEWIAAWNAHDLERILDYYADDVELISPFVPRLMSQSESLLRGKAATLRNARRPSARCARPTRNCAGKLSSAPAPRNRLGNGCACPHLTPRWRWRSMPA